MQLPALRSSTAWILVAILGSSSSATAFVTGDALLQFDGSELDIERTLTIAARWSTIPLVVPGGREIGLHDGIQVGVEPGFAEAFGAATPEEVQDYHDLIFAAFAAWESPVLHFEVTLDVEGVKHSFEGSEIDVFASPETDPVWSGNFFHGFARCISLPLDVGSTNGDILPGWTIGGADLFLNFERILAFADDLGLTREEHLANLQRLLMHEIGHTIGLHHPNDLIFANLDTDLDPTNAIPVDPADPFAGLFVSPNFDEAAIMTATFENQFFSPELRNDDIGGRDVLYPVPEPSRELLGLAALGAVGGLGATGASRRRGLA